MRPVTPNNNPPYHLPATMVTNDPNIVNNLMAYGIQPEPLTNDTFNLQAVLTLLSQLTFQNNGTAKWMGIHAQGRILVPAMIHYFTNAKNCSYGNARGSLIDNYGQYCGYCGTPVQDSALAIEHCLPKSVFPALMLNYSNFFLACPSCNSYKGSKPTYAISRTWAINYIVIPPNPITMANIVSGGFSRQLWPNSNYAWRGFPVSLFNITNNATIPIIQSTTLTNTLVNVVQNIVEANIAGFAQPIKVASLIETQAFNVPVLQLQENNFIDIVKLNTYTQNYYGDRRVTNRTVAWLNVLSSLNALQQFTVGSNEWGLMLGQIFKTAKAAGFFEIWSMLFYQISGPSVGQNSIYMIFRTASTNPAYKDWYFPGTNINQLPNN